MAALENAQIATAIVTGLAAVATAAMAWETHRVAHDTGNEAAAVREAAESASRQVEIATRALHTSIRPWLTSAGKADCGHGSGAGGVMGYVVLRNVGTGIALVDASEGSVFGWRTGDTAMSRFPGVGVDEPVVAPGESTVARFALKETTAAWTGLDFHQFIGRERHNGSFAVEIFYTDVEGNQSTLVRVYVAADDPSLEFWTPYQIEYRHERDEEPFASVRARGR